MAGQGDDCRMVEIVVPQGIQTVAADLGRPYQSDVLRLVLGNKVGGPAAGGLPYAASDDGQDVIRGVVVNVLRGVQTKSVQMEFFNPVAGVGDKKFADRTGIGIVKIDRVAPVDGVSVGEVVFRKLFHIAAVRAKVVVDDIEDDAEFEGMGAVDKAAHVVGCTVEPGRREQIDAVVAPAEFARQNRPPA